MIGTSADPVKRSVNLVEGMTLPQLVRAESLKFQVARILQEAVFNGKLKPGQALREIGLAREFGVSQATVREALTHLEQVGLVVKTPNKGTEVTNLSAAEVRDRLAVRLALEELAAGAAALRITSEDLAGLEEAARTIEDGIRQNLYFEVSQADLQFHRLIWKASGNAILYRTLDQITTPLFAFLGLLHQRSRQDQKKTRPHSEILNALRARDGEQVRRALRSHIEDSYGVFLRSEAADLQSMLEQGEQL